MEILGNILKIVTIANYRINECNDIFNSIANQLGITYNRHNIVQQTKDHTVYTVIFNNEYFNNDNIDYNKKTYDRDKYNRNKALQRKKLKEGI